ncbi:MAG: hypothetical protein U9Q82_11300 [Chloroflexota bacterium]|nr:hypothetical protein [Chloroflexota bacterium]
MKDRQLKLRIATNPYGGNGGLASEHPDVRKWLMHNCEKIKADPRIEDFSVIRDIATYVDTPIPMTRNAAVMEARQAKADLLLFIDSDQAADSQLGYDPDAVPFWDAAFNFIYARWDKGPYVVGAPYLGGDPHHENVFVMRWRRHVSSFNSEVDLKLDQYTREESHEMSGIHECAALPTGLILYDMRAFDLIEPAPDNVAKTIAGPLVKRIEAGNNQFTAEQMRELVAHVVHETRRAEKPFFYYEFTDRYEWQKASTEDVTNTRDISLAGLAQLGYNPVHCAWSSWAGHWKARNVEKPSIITAKEVSQKFITAANRKQGADYKLKDISRSSAPEKVAQL